MERQHDRHRVGNRTQSSDNLLESRGVIRIFRTMTSSEHVMAGFQTHGRQNAALLARQFAEVERNVKHDVANVRDAICDALCR